MNLNMIAGTVLNGSGVHEYQDAEVYFYQGFENIYGAVKPSYSEPVPVLVQIQNLPTGALRQNNEYNEASFNKVVYLNFGATTVDRLRQNGGDIIKCDGNWWLVTDYRDDFLEAGWISAVATLQIEIPEGLND